MEPAGARSACDAPVATRLRVMQEPDVSISVLTVRRLVRAVALPALALAMAMGGCDVDNYMDPSQTGYFETTPTTMPVLSRLDVIEKKVDRWGGPVVAPTTEDLTPNDVEYRLEPGDIVRIEIYELVAAGQTSVNVRRVEQNGTVRLPTLYDVRAGGLTIQELQEEIEERLKGFISDPLVTVVLEEGRSYRYILYGAIGNPGIYSLDQPDFRLLDAVALASGTLDTTQRIYVIRNASLDESLEPAYRRESAGTGSDQPINSVEPASEGTPAGDIESLIDLLDSPGTAPGAVGSAYRLGQDGRVPLVDIEAVESAEQRRAEPIGGGGGGDAQWVFDGERQEWVRRGGGDAAPASPTATDGEAPLYAVRILEIDYQRLKRGDPTQNIVIRPGDYIFIDPPESGLVYIGGNIARPGPYDLPTVGNITLSRLVTAAGEFNAIAIPGRVDLIRKVGPDREATIRVNITAIRNRAEPDIVMREGDHVIIGTDFLATPLAVIRNGFRANYGFGFLLDRNFGNDVFGPPPESFRFGN
jgi:polysaccharide biosynthesis/export protein